MKNTTESTETKKEQPIKSDLTKEILSWIKAGILTLIIYLFINFFIFTARVDGPSMLPTFTHGDLIFVSRIAYTLPEGLPEYNDIVIFSNEIRGYEIIKRVIGLPGDHIEIKDNQVYRNGSLLQETYLDESIITEGNIDEIIQEGHIFVLGDNRQNSADSRISDIGQVSMDDVKGRVLVRVIPNFKIF